MVRPQRAERLGHKNAKRKAVCRPGIPEPDPKRTHRLRYDIFCGRTIPQAAETVAVPQ